MYKMFSVLLLVLFIAGGMYVSSSSLLADEDCTSNSQVCGNIDQTHMSDHNYDAKMSGELPVKTYVEKKEKIYYLEQQSKIESQKKLQYNQKLREEGKIIVEEYEYERQKSIQESL